MRRGGIHVTFTRYCRAVSRRDGQLFPPKSSRNNDGEVSSSTSSSVYTVRNYVGVRRLYLSDADSKFTSTIVVRNVLSIYPVTYFYSRHASTAISRSAIPFDDPIMYLSTTLSQVTTRSRMWSSESDFSCLPGSTRRNDEPPVEIGNPISIESVISKGSCLRKRKFYRRDKGKVKWLFFPTGTKLIKSLWLRRCGARHRVCSVQVLRRILCSLRSRMAFSILLL